MKISIVIICKEEGLVIEKVLDSVIQSINFCQGWKNEIILVDSNSKDNTVNLAKRTFEKNKYSDYTIIEYKSNYHTAALSREIGKKYTRGKYILFLDGDMILNKDFLKNIKYINKNVVGIVGKRFDVVDLHSNEKNEFKRNVKKDSSIIDIGGALLISAKDAKKVGYIELQKTREEETLAKRLKNEGKIIKYIEEDMFIHLDYKRKNRNIVERIVQIRQTAKDVAIGLKIINKEVGLRKTIENYFDYINDYIIVPIINIGVLFLTLKTSYVFGIVFFVLLGVYLKRNKLKSIFPIFFLIYLFSNTRINQNFDVISEVKVKDEN